MAAHMAVPKSVLEPLLAHDELGALAVVALRAGQLLLLAGADTRRVEETVQRLGLAMGAQAMDVYVTPTGIVVSAVSGADYRTRLVRVIGAGVDLARIDAINHLARRASREHLDRAQIAAELERIARLPRGYTRAITFPTVAIACACFALLFGGGWREGIAVFGATFVALSFRDFLLARRMSFFLLVPLASFVAVLLAVLVARALGIASHEVVVPSSVLFLVPGVPLITALSDLLAGDLISGVTRAAQAILVATAIAAGVALALALPHALGLGA
jgi:uncharacterized membrane protein YjjP (DUF1212 family)